MFDVWLFFVWFLRLWNLKNRAPVEATRWCSQNRRFRFKSKSRLKKRRTFEAQILRKSINIDVKNPSEKSIVFGIDFSWFGLSIWVPNEELKLLKKKLRHLGLTWAKRAPQEAPREPKWSQKVPQEGENETKRHQENQNDPPNYSKTPARPSRCPRTTFSRHQWKPPVLGFKRGGFQGSAQEVPKSRPRSAQEGPRAAQGRPKAGQLTLKSRPKEAPTLLESIPASHETRFEQEFCGKLCSAGSRSDFMSFFGSCDKLAICKNLRKT